MMTFTRAFAATLVVVACIMPATVGSNTDEPEALVAEDKISADAVRSYFKAAFLKAEIDKDGDICVEADGATVFVSIDAKRKLIRYFGFARLKASVSELEKLRAINRLNDDFIVVRFSMSKHTSVVCDYYLSYENGVSAYSIVNSYRLFTKVAKDAVARLGRDNILDAR